MNLEEEFLKQQAPQEAAINGTDQMGWAHGQAPSPEYANCKNANAGSTRPRSMADQKAHEASHHHDQAKRAAEAADFLRAHPEFEQFIHLLRSGAISV